jgi:two-component system alkaline phosphatase synthesis response regulator PhoP
MNEKILIVDDEKSIVDPINFALKKEGYITACAYDGEEALQKCDVFKPDVVILDEMLPQLDGFGVLKNISRNCGTGVIMLTAKSDIIDKVVGLELGADDYMTKPFDMRELLSRIRTLLRRMAKASDKERNMEIRVSGLEINIKKRRASVDGELLELTPKEFDLLALLLSSPGVVYSRDRLLDIIWGMDYFGGSRTVDIHIQRLRKKLGIKYQDILQTVHGIGYKAGEA